MAEVKFDDETLSELRSRAAGILEETGEIEAAAEVYLDLGNWNAMLQLIMANAPAFVEVGRFQVLTNWFSRIPAEVVSETPWLLYWQGVGSLLLDPMGNLAKFEKAFALFREQGPDREQGCEILCRNTGWHGLCHRSRRDDLFPPSFHGPTDRYTLPRDQGVYAEGTTDRGHYHTTGEG